MSYQTNWRARAEHSGFYLAVAAGIHRTYCIKCDLRVGGPQISNSQLLLGGQVDIIMSNGLEAPPHWRLAQAGGREEELVQRLVTTTLEGWAEYLEGGPKIEATKAQIEKDNPGVTDDRIAHAIKVMNENGIISPAARPPSASGR